MNDYKTGGKEVNVPLKDGTHLATLNNVKVGVVSKTGTKTEWHFNY